MLGTLSTPLSFVIECCQEHVCFIVIGDISEVWISWCAYSEILLGGCLKFPVIIHRRILKPTAEHSGDNNPKITIFFSPVIPIFCILSSNYFKCGTFCIACFECMYFPQCLFLFQISVVNNLLKVSWFSLYMCMW